jgi:hypothetical protein
MATKEFKELALDGSNYPTWVSDIKIALASHTVIQEKHTFTALALLWFYIYKDLKSEYLMIKNSR